MFLKRLTETGNKTMPTSLNVDSPPSATLIAPTSAHVSSVSGSVVVKVKGAQSCPTLCDPIDYTVHGVLQARILE